MKRVLSLLLVLALLLPFISTASAEGAEAKDITKHCTFELPGSSFKKAVDGNTGTVWTGEEGSGQTVGIEVGSGYRAGGLYFRWNAEPPAWTLYAVGDGGATETVMSGGDDGFLSDYEAIPSLYSGCSRFELRLAGDVKPSIAELSVFSEGRAPAYAPHWQPFAGRADIMIVSAHPDDDQLFLGGVAPTYIQQGKRSVTVFMTYGKPLRRFEAMEGVWASGGRIYPVLGPFVDKLTYSVADAKKYWPEDKALSFLVEQIRRYKPAVIVTHGVGGEYGHGAHMLTCQLVQQAFERSGDAEYDPESAEQYGVWNPAKLYLHAYKTDKLTLDTSQPLSLFGGKTAFEVAKAGYDRHISQHVWSFKVSETGRDSIREFGLAATRVGQDSRHDDMFENVTAKALASLNPQYVDKTALASVIGCAASISQSQLAMLRWAAVAFSSALARANAVMADGDATQSEVNAAAISLAREIGLLFCGQYGYR